jgi:hypothetical protein
MAGLEGPGKDFRNVIGLGREIKHMCHYAPLLNFSSLACSGTGFTTIVSPEAASL